MLVVHDLDHSANAKCGAHNLAQTSVVEKQFKILQVCNYILRAILILLFFIFQAIYQSSRREMPENLIESLKQKNEAVRRSAKKAVAKSGKGISVSHSVFRVNSISKEITFQYFP